MDLWFSHPLPGDPQYGSIVSNEVHRVNAINKLVEKNTSSSVGSLEPPIEGVFQDLVEGL